MNDNARFYDNDSNFCAFMTLFEKLDENLQEEIAQDIILNISRFVCKNNDDLLNNIMPSSAYKRWYDKSPAVHMAVEELKRLDKNKRAEMIASVSDMFLGQLEEF